MTTTADELDVDLLAWDAPPAPAGLADAVVARMGVPALAAAPDEAREESRDVRRRSYAIAAAALACLVLGAATYALTRVKDSPTSIASGHAPSAPSAPAPASSTPPAPAGAPAHAPPEAVASVGTELDREAISNAMTSIRPQVAQCATKSTKQGKVKVMIKVRPDGKVGASSATETYDAAVSSCILGAIKTLQFPVTDQGGSFSYPFVLGAARCDAQAAVDRGNQETSFGEFAKALASYEEALQCSGTDFAIVRLAFMSACNGKNAQKAYDYYGKLTSDDQTRLIVLCTRNGIDPKVLPAPACDAQELKDRGMEHINMGEHAEAVAAFESAYRCKVDATLPMIIATEACAAGDFAKSKTWRGRLSPADQAKVAKACAQSTVTPDGAGYLEVGSTPAGASVIVDGKDTGLTTPTNGHKLPLKAGKHKLTLVLGEDRFTWPVTIQAGGVVIFHKDLE